MNINGISRSENIARQITQSSQAAKTIIPKTEALIEDAKQRGANAIQAVLSSGLISGQPGGQLNITV